MSQEETLTSTEPVYGKVVKPPSRAALYLPEWVASAMESGKFFPAKDPGLSDPYAPDDVMSEAPPPDGKIASAGHKEALALDQPKDPNGMNWKSHHVTSGQSLDIEWKYTAAHKTRRWNYFITKTTADLTKPLTRAQFETKPLHTVQLSCQPYWQCGKQLNPPMPTKHTMKLPQRKGHQAILAVWELADTPRAFYQLIDLEFSA